MSKDTENKDIIESMSILLQVNEELKVLISTVSKDPTELPALINKQALSISKLAQLLLVTKKGIETELGELENCKKEMIQRINEQESTISEMQKGIKSLEFKESEEILSKLRNDEKITDNDLKTVNILLVKYPNEEGLLYLKGVLLEELGKDKELADYFKKLVAEQPDNYFMTFMQATFTPNIQGKIEYMERAIKLLNEKAYYRHSVYHDYANLLLKVRKLDSALENINKALEFDRKCAIAWNDKGRILLKLGNNPEALGCIETGLSLDAQESRLWISKGDALAALGYDHLDEATTCYDKCIALSPKDSTGYVSKTVFLLNLDNYDDALKTINDGIKVDDKDPCMYYYKGCILYQLKKPEEAIESFKRVFAVTGDYCKCPPSIHYLATTYGQFGYSKNSRNLLKVFVLILSYGVHLIISIRQCWITPSHGIFSKMGLI